MSTRKAARKPGSSAWNVTGSVAERDAAVLTTLGERWKWHYGTIRAMGIYAGARRAVDVVWDEGIQSNGGEAISDESWEILRLAFKTTRRIRTLSDREDSDWAFDFWQVQACTT